MTKNSMWTVVVAGAVAWTLGAGIASAGLPFDHLKCYKAKDPAPKGSFTATLAGGFNISSAGCTIKVPAKMVCNAVEKLSVDPAPPHPGVSGQNLVQQLFVCYKAKCPKESISQPGRIDQFGSRDETLSTTKLLCAPSPRSQPGI